ncbi:ABC transporter substrate-binding protein [bacterium]|nr:ABC transporter substrate-binding protein [bacterium]
MQEPMAPAEEPQAQAPQDEPIKIGAIFAITGRAAWLGEPEARTAEMIIEKVNGQGGINGRVIELIVKDTQGAEDRAVNAVRDLFREDVVAIIGPSRSGTSMAVADMCEEQQMPLISCAALAQITEGRKWVFKTPQKDSDVVIRIYEYMRDHGMTRVALITGTTGFGAGGREKLKEMAPEYGLEVVADETYGPGDTDMTPHLTRIRGTNPQAIVNWSIIPGQSIVMKNMKELGMSDIQIFQSHGFGNYGYLKAAGDAAEGVLFPAGRALVVDDLPADHPQKEVLSKLKQDYETRYDEPLSTFAGHAYDALWLVLDAIENVGADRAAIRDYIENRKGFVGTGGVFNFSPEDHTGLDKDSLEMLTVRNGKFAIPGGE